MTDPLGRIDKPKPFMGHRNGYITFEKHETLLYSEIEITAMKTPAKCDGSDLEKTVGLHEIIS